MRYSCDTLMKLQMTENRLILFHILLFVVLVELYNDVTVHQMALLNNKGLCLFIVEKVIKEKWFGLVLGLNELHKI